MDYTYLYQTYQFNEKMLLEAGFTKKDDFFTYQEDIHEHFYFVLTLTKDHITVKVYDQDFDEEYLPFANKNANGNLVSSIRDEVEKCIEKILKPYQMKDEWKEKVLTYAKEKYNTDPEYPWEDCNATLKTKNSKKWYGLLMDIPYARLQKNTANETIVHALNIKCDPEQIPTLIDNKNFFPAYHMNKKYWITILLSSNLNESLLYELIDQSYQLVEK